MAKKTKNTTTQTAKRPGRPSSYSAKMADAICQEIAQGQSLKKICERDDRPCCDTVYLWLNKYQEFSDKYTRARSLQAEFWAHEILEIADTPQEGIRIEEGTGSEGVYSKEVREDMLGHRRLQVDARKWLMSKLAPKKYGDKTSMEHSGPDGGPIKTQDVSDQDRARALAAFVAKTRVVGK